MDESLNLSSVMVVRRKPKALPSVMLHALSAVIVLLAIPLIAYSAIQLSGNPKDAVADGQVKIEPLPLPSSDPTLVENTGSLPDLLNGVVPEDVNPTEILDALGNPIGAIPGQTGDLAGGNAADQPQTIIPQPVPSGPKVVMIDGRPLDGSQTVIEASPLPRVPMVGLTRPSPFGTVPKISETGRKVVSAYARPFTPTAGKKPVSVIIGGLGIDQGLTRRFINETPPEVTLSFAAHSPGLQSLINQARARGHEVLIELPMESASFNPAEPGADKTLKANETAARNIRNLDWLMSRAQGYFAVTNYNGDTILNRSDAIAPVLAHLSDAGLGFIYDGSSTMPSLSALAQSAGLPYESAFNLLDSQPSASAVRAELTRLAAQAGQGSNPVGVGFAYPQTLETLKGWLAGLDAEGLEIAPASQALLK